MSTCKKSQNLNLIKNLIKTHIKIALNLIISQTCGSKYPLDKPYITFHQCNILPTKACYCNSVPSSETVVTEVNFECIFYGIFEIMNGANS